MKFCVSSIRCSMFPYKELIEKYNGKMIRCVGDKQPEIAEIELNSLKELQSLIQDTEVPIIIDQGHPFRKNGLRIRIYDDWLE